MIRNLCYNKEIDFKHYWSFDTFHCYYVSHMHPTYITNRRIPGIIERRRRRPSSHVRRTHVLVKHVRSSISYSWKYVCTNLEHTYVTAGIVARNDINISCQWSLFLLRKSTKRGKLTGPPLPIFQTFFNFQRTRNPVVRRLENTTAVFWSPRRPRRLSVPTSYGFSYFCKVLKGV